MATKRKARRKAARRRPKVRARTKRKKTRRKAVSKTRRIDFSKIKWGTLTKWLKRHEKKIRRVFGKRPFTAGGKINKALVRVMLSNPEKLKRITRRSPLILRKLRFYYYILARSRK